MRLDRLELSGFKSFPDRADVAFDAGVTAIVGPNGCGKSNLVDAITWVLGEQSAKSLRGDRMEDVIFSGSDARKATAAAEVRLRLSGVPTDAARRSAAKREGAPVDEPDHPPGSAPEPRQVELPAADTRPVEIARRLYRSGESEYLIDGEVCRLRDIQDLLMDAGLGVKAYAVIEQGKIGQILSAKPTDRRQLIEEAAGVTKYKSRRRAAELKLDAAQQNLTRIDDIVFELERQVGTLKRQAAKARRYKRLREELRRWEKVLFARRYRVLLEQAEAGRARLAEARRREEDARARLDGAERHVQDVRQASTMADTRLYEARELVHARQMENERREQQLAFDRQQVEMLSASLVDLAKELEALQARREPARVELESRMAAAGAADRERDEAAGRSARAESAVRDADAALQAAEHEVDDLRSRLFALQNTVTTLEHAIERAQDSRNRLSDSMVRLDAEVADLGIETDRLRAEQEQAHDRLADASAAIELTRERRRSLEATLAATRAERESRMAELREREREVAGLAARRTSLQELEVRRAGYADAARLLLADNASGVAHDGSVADYVDTDKTWERAIEALLGDLLQCVVVPAHADAQSGLQFVRARNAGRVGFLMLDAPAADPAPASLPEGVLPARAVIRISGAHEPSIAAALRGVFVAETPELARAASATLGGPVATIGGEVYRGGRVVFGGTRGEGRGILGVKREIRELHGHLETELRRVADLGQRIADLDAMLTSTDRELAGVSADLHAHEKNAVGFELQVQGAVGELERLASKRDQAATERRQAEEERRAADARSEEARVSIVRTEDERRALQERFVELQQRLVDARERAAAAARCSAEEKAKHAALLERSSALAAEVRRIEDAAKDLEAREGQTAEERRRAEERRAELIAAIETGERRREEDTRGLAALERDAADAERSSKEAHDQGDRAESAARDARGVLDATRTHVAQLEVAQATTDADLTHLSESCQETLQLSIEEVAAEVETTESGGEPSPAVTAAPSPAPSSEDLASELGRDDEPVEEDGDQESEAVAHATTAEETIAALKARIDRLGPVNMMAIEQFEELETRHTFLSSQRQDLIDSIATTGEAIKRIDKTTRERFREAFAAINQYFEETFTTLFGGGRAGLTLLDDSDLLESGIDIIAQPPGKRLQNVQLLSGGEKALTAMSLMFAIFRYRPSPFCLLDEIDAPLDDANIARFIEMLRGMMDRTQFILVTHHRKTMEIADRLYGVTMEEPGVSKLISIRLN